jgi:hypothetical protein
MSIDTGMQTEAISNVMDIQNWKHQMKQIVRCFKLAIQGMTELTRCFILNSNIANPALPGSNNLDSFQIEQIFSGGSIGTYEEVNFN